MRECEQSPGQSVWAHGQSVAGRYAELVAFLHSLHCQSPGDPGSGTGLAGWRLPQWLTENAALLLSQQVDFGTAQRYQLFHDCGKPYCLEVDAQGRRHFPGHAAVSTQLWRELGGDALEVALIAEDMDIHLLPAAELAAFAARPTAATLLLTGLAEVHANAQMFGGLESVSFKAKWKHLDRRGRALCALSLPI